MVKFQGIAVRVQNLFAAGNILVRDGEDDVLALVVAVGLQDHIDVDFFFCEQAEYLVGHTRHVRHRGQRDPGNLLILRHTGNISLFHVLDYLLDNRTGISGKAGQNLQLHAVALGELY